MSSPLAGAFAAGLIPLIHSDALGVPRAPVDLGEEAAVPPALVDDLRRQLSLNHLCDSRWIGILAGLGVPGLEG